MHLWVGQSGKILEERTATLVLMKRLKKITVWMQQSRKQYKHNMMLQQVE